jgi:hypothetical protein
MDSRVLRKNKNSIIPSSSILNKTTTQIQSHPLVLKKHFKDINNKNPNKCLHIVWQQNYNQT